MDRKFIWTWIAVLTFSFGSALAQDDGADAETTIRLMGAAEAELPDAVTKEIALPESVPVDTAAVENAASGPATANENRARRENGLETADAAQERGAEMADDASENRENRGRSEENRPDDPPEPPGNLGPPGS